MQIVRGLRASAPSDSPSSSDPRVANGSYADVPEEFVLSDPSSSRQVVVRPGKDTPQPHKFEASAARVKHVKRVKDVLMADIGLDPMSGEMQDTHQEDDKDNACNGAQNDGYAAGDKRGGDCQQPKAVTTESEEYDFAQNTSERQPAAHLVDGDAGMIAKYATPNIRASPFQSHRRPFI